MSVIRTVWSKAYADNYGDIFRKPAVPQAGGTACTHRGESGKFCMKHQGGCGLHYNLEPDGRCECQDCPPMPEGAVRPKVCECHIHEHCGLCDPHAFHSRLKPM